MKGLVRISARPARKTPPTAALPGSSQAIRISTPYERTGSGGTSFLIYKSRVESGTMAIHTHQSVDSGIWRGAIHRSGKPLDIKAIRKHFLFPRNNRIVTNNAATTQIPIELLKMYERLAEGYENIHRGQSRASRQMTELFEEAYETIASFLNAPSGKRNIVLYRNTTEAINSVMYSMMSEFRDGDNLVTTMMEHNSNYVPWYAMCQEILPRFGVKVGYRIVNFSPENGELDIEQMARLIDNRTKLVCCTGASNFLGTKPPLKAIRAMSRASGYHQPNGIEGSYLLIDGAQLVPSNPIDVQALDADFLAFSLHKMLAPFGVGALYAREGILESMLPFLYGGDMIAQGQVFPDSVSYSQPPWKYTAGTPNILGGIVSAQAIRLMLDFAIDPDKHTYFNSDKNMEPEVVRSAMSRTAGYLGDLTGYAYKRFSRIPGIRIYGPPENVSRAALIAFNIAGKDPMWLSEKLDGFGIESRAGCHCATLAHHYLHLDPPASCRLSFYIYNTLDEVEMAAQALDYILSGRRIFKA